MITIDPAAVSDRRWQTLCGNFWRENIHPFLVPAFLKGVMGAYGLQGYYLLCLRHDRPYGIASVFIRRDFAGRSFIDTTPGGFWTQNPDVEPILLQALKRIAKERHCRIGVMRSLFQPLSTQGRGRVEFRAVKRLDSEKSLIRSYSKSIQRHIRVAKRNGLVVVIDSRPESFYKAWASRMRDLGTPPVPLRFFKHLRENFRNRFVVIKVMHDHHCIGGAILLRGRDIVVDPFIGNCTTSLKFFPNALLYHEMLTWAVRNGYRYFDLGSSIRDSGNEKFKLRFNPELLPIFTYSLQKPKQYERHQSTVSTVWQNLPLSVSNFFGGMIRKRMPFRT